MYTTIVLWVLLGCCCTCSPVVAFVAPSCLAVTVKHTTLWESKGEAVDNKQPSDNLFSKFVSNLQTASRDGFGTRARNIGSTMDVGEVVVPLCGNLEKRSSLAQLGLYAGVEYIICDITEGSGNEGERLTSERVATIKPAYPLREHLERSDWPISLPVSEVPLWLPRSTYEAGTAIGTLALAGTYLSIALIISTFLRVVIVPSESMEPALMPRDVIIVTRSIFTKPKANDVVFFNTPSELDVAIANSKIGRAAAAEAEVKSNANNQQPQPQIVSTKGKQFVKRVVGVPGDTVGVSNSNPYVEICNDAGTDCNFRVDKTGPYQREDVFQEDSWNRGHPTINLGAGIDPKTDTATRTLAKGQYFVAGDNGYRSVDSRVWGPLKDNYLFGTAKFIIYPLNHFGPIQPGPFTIQDSITQ